jgi:membrane protein DedA with SNARE-associated domain
MDFAQIIFEAIKNNGVISVIIAGLVEQVIVPIPSPVIPMAAGFIFVPQNVAGFLEILKTIFLKAALPFAIGSTIGSTIVYLAAWYGGKWLINKFSRWLEITWNDVELVKEKYFRDNYYDALVIFISRAIPIVPSVLFSAACGAIRIKPITYYATTALGLLVRGIILGWIGWRSGEALFSIADGLDSFGTIMNLVFVLLIGGLLLWAYFKREKWLENLRQNNK